MSDECLYEVLHGRFDRKISPARENVKPDSRRWIQQTDLKNWPVTAVFA